jgi:hypothetical protein
MQYVYELWCDTPVVGQFVYISKFNNGNPQPTNVLSLAEVGVFGQSFPNSYNWAAKKKAMQSSTYNPLQASNAFDGRLETFSHTMNGDEWIAGELAS